MCLQRLAHALIRTVGNAAGLQSELVRMGTVRVELPNGKTLALWTRGDDWISNCVYWKGWTGYEPETSRIFFPLSTLAKVTIDVGAYIGFYALLAAHANPKGQIFAFEPVPKTYQRLLTNIDLNGVSNIESVGCAVGDYEGITEFYCGTSDLSLVSGRCRDFTGSFGDVRTMSVPLITLDTYLAKNHVARVDLIKIDTETTEDQVLRGMLQTLKRDHPHIICEVHHAKGVEPSLEEILEPLGYRYYLLTPEGPKLRNRLAGNREWVNYLFTTVEIRDLLQVPAQSNL